MRELAVRSVKLALPIAGGYLLVVATLLFEIAVVGHEVGGSGVAAIGLAATLALVIVLTFHAVELAGQTIVARRFGERNYAATGKVLDNALALAFAISVPLTLILLLLGDEVFSAAKSREIEQLAFEYFRWRLPGIPFLVGMLAMIGFFNGIGQPKYYISVFALVLVLNVCLIFVLVGGRMGLPALGIAGAGLAATLSSVAGFCIFVAILLKQKFRRQFNCLHFRTNLDVKVIKALFLLGYPIFVQQFFGNFSIFVFMNIFARINDENVSLAASTIARNIGYLTYLPSLGFGIAAASLVSQRLGSNDPRPAKLAGWICWAVGASLMCLAGLVFIFFGHELTLMFLESTAGGGENGVNADNAAVVIALTKKILIIVGCYQIFEAANTIFGKALQGAGITRFVMTTAVTVQWFFLIPAAYIVAIPLGYGAIGAWFAFAAQLFIAGTVFILKFHSGTWTQKRL